MKKLKAIRESTVWDLLTEKEQRHAQVVLDALATSDEMDEELWGGVLTEANVISDHLATSRPMRRFDLEALVEVTERMYRRLMYERSDHNEKLAALEGEDKILIPLGAEELETTEAFNALFEETEDD